MSRSLLSELGPDAGQAAGLANKELQRLLRFLLRWEDSAGVLACLDALGPSTLVSIYDLRAEALAAEGRHAEAVATMQARLALKESPSAWIQLGEVYLAAGNPIAAQAVLEDVARGDGPPAAVWPLLGEARLAQGQLDAAEAVFLRALKVSPESRVSLAGLAAVERGRGNPVASSAYAVRAFSVEEGQYAPAVPLLRRLRDLFRETGDTNRLAEAETQLAERFARELEELRSALAGADSAPAAAAPDGAPGAARGQAAEPGSGGKVKARGAEPRTAKGPPGSPPQAEESPRSDEGPSAAPESLAAVPVGEAERAQLLAAAQQYFGFPSLLPAQAEIMASARRGENVLAVLPTGGGKSLCYQLPALMDPPGRGVTLVISPLIALMKDQLDNLPEPVRSRAIAINSSLEGRELREAIAALRSGRYSLVYAAPERLRQPPFLHALRTAGLARLVIDEAHCVSIWGHDFRPDYLAIARVAHDLGDPPILALTATAPARVRADIQRRLFGDGQDASNSGRSFRIIATDTYRPNLTLSAIYVRDEDEKLGRVMDLCRGLPGSGIVYAPTRRRCEDLAAMLARQGVAARVYHAGLDQPARSAAQEAFMAGEARVIVATVAFGMGIDKRDIRFIIHFGLPRSVEAYYQEAGRAGRDGQPAHCVLLYANSDRATLTRHAHEGLMTVEYLRQVYQVASRRLRRRNPQVIPLAELLAEIGGEETQLRVALSILEQTGLLARDYDTPASAGLRWSGWRGGNGSGPTPPAGPPALDPLLDRLIEAADLAPGQPVTRDLLDLAVACGTEPGELEQRLLGWHGSGVLDYLPSGRDLLLSLPSAPGDAAQRIDSLLTQYAAIQQQRVTEIWDYARATRCRHGHLANYLGGRPRRSCAACDNCLPDSGLPAAAEGAAGPETAEQLRAILAVLSERGLGRRNLTLLLRGDPDAPARASDRRYFGVLSHRSESGIGKLIDALITAGYVEEVRLSHGGVALNLSPAGRRVLDAPASASPLAHLLRPSAPLPRRWADIGGQGVLPAGRPAVVPAGSGASAPDGDRLSPQPRPGKGPPFRGAAPLPGFGAAPRNGGPLPDASSPVARPGSAGLAFDPDDRGQVALFERLRAWRTAEARRKAVSPYMIFHDEVLRSLAAARPGTSEDLASIKGLGPAKLAEYGEAVLEVIRSSA